MPKVWPYGTGAAETVLLVRRPAAKVWILYRQWLEPAYKWILYDWVRDGPRMLGICHSRYSDCRGRRRVLYHGSGTGAVEGSVRNAVFDTGSDIESGTSGLYGFDLFVFLLLRMGRKGPWVLKKNKPPLRYGAGVICFRKIRRARCRIRRTSRRSHGIWRRQTGRQDRIMKSPAGSAIGRCRTGLRRIVAGTGCRAGR